MKDHCFAPQLLNGVSFNGVCVVREWFQSRPRPIEWDVGIIVSESETVTNADGATLKMVIQPTAGQVETIKSILQAVIESHKDKLTHVILAPGHKESTLVIPAAIDDTNLVLHAGI